jgi:hypothetical protein
VGGIGGPGRPGGPGGGASQLPANSRPGARPSQLPSNNLYNGAGNKDRLAPSSKQRSAGLQKADRVSSGRNNVYADRSGNVQRQTSQGWQQRNNGQWKNSSGSGMNRDYQARQRGSSSYGGRGGYSGGSRGGGGRGGGGGRR